MNISFACKECGYMIIKSNINIDTEVDSFYTQSQETTIECDHCKMKYKIKIKLKYNKKEDGD